MEEDVVHGTPTTSGIDFRNSWSSAQGLLNSIKKLEESLGRRPRLKVWVGDGISISLFFNNILEEPPKLVEDKLIDECKYYIVAGFGIIAGSRAYTRLRKLNVVLEWSTYPVEYSTKLEGE